MSQEGVCGLGCSQMRGVDMRDDEDTGNETRDQADVIQHSANGRLQKILLCVENRSDNHTAAEYNRLQKHDA